MTSNIIRHGVIRQSAALALLAIVFSAMAFAQPAARQTPPPKVNLIIERNAVRFDRQGEASAWQLEVFNQPGDLVFASGAVHNQKIEWPLADQQGQPLAGGLYEYRLKFWDENNEDLGVQCGHIIIDRASRDDRIWVTSNNGVGAASGLTDLTVAGSPEATVGGARLTAEVEQVPLSEAGERLRAAVARAAEGQARVGPGVINAVGPISGEGIANRIAKFTGANTIEETSMSESNGRIMINTTIPSGRLSVAEIGSTPSIYAQNYYGIFQPASGAIAIQGVSSGAQGIGVSGAAPGIGVSGDGGTGVYGDGDSYGVYGVTSSSSIDRAGVYGVGSNSNGSGVIGRSNSGNGVRGITGSASHAAVYGDNAHSEGIGVHGVARLDANQASIGVRGSGSGWGVVGVGVAGHGVAGYGSSGASIYGASGATWAGFFDGDVDVTGNLSKGGGSFKIDHPLDPGNKYLYHSFVESPDMMNIYNGNVTTGGNGESTVTLPDYFEALNRDFRYQLTVIGQFAQAIVASKIEGNRFTIRTDKPNVEVSWQVTGVRQDAFANKHRIPVEEEKPAAERGHLLHPAAFNQPEEKSIEWARRPEMMKRMKVDREQRQEARTRKSQQ